MTWQAEITQILNTGYGDASTTQLDVEVAEAIERWAIGKVALFVHAAGGRVAIPARDWIDPPSLTLYRLTESLDPTFVIKTEGQRQGETPDG